MKTRPWAMIPLLLLLSACVVDGQYVVRGTVLGATESEPTPITGALVSVGGAEEGRRFGAARTSPDGAYEAEYVFGGMFPLVFGAYPSVEYSAPGYRKRKLALRSEDAPPGVTRRPCEERSFGRCFTIDVVLEPAAPAAERERR